MYTLGHAGYSPTFMGSIRSGFTPGMDYNSNNMYAIAPCYLTHFDEIRGTGRLGYNYAQFKYVNLDPSIPNTHVFQSQYAHIGKLRAPYGKLINRGDIIADVPEIKHAKLMFFNEGSLVDPDNYGANHSYMRYELDNKEEITNLSERHQKQEKAFNQLFQSSHDEVKQKITDREHRPYREHKYCNWDYIEKFRYLSELYQARSNLFTDMPKDRFEELKAEFYANQPIILTLPIKA